ncbi:MAG: hypothetical protein ACRESJ_29165 [Pseudomonas sp.]|uniref:hypothetical protein n=1 Tax=Pseudomonas sp. TaxID=306 RepID=UPI003D6EA783
MQAKIEAPKPRTFGALHFRASLANGVTFTDITFLQAKKPLNGGISVVLFSARYERVLQEATALDLALSYWLRATGEIRYDQFTSQYNRA